ncbi:MAG: hypothetical protein IT538_06180 [Variibacter sp.]|nr:hypothetical protein [Variibacter sp.]
MTLPLPPIAIGAFDHLGLVRLAGEATKRRHPVAAFLLAELRRARVAPQAEMVAFARPHGWVTCRADEASPAQSRILTYPEQCSDPDLYLSLLSPLGAAVLGLSAGARMPYQDSDGRRRTAVVESLRAPANVLVFRPVRVSAPSYAASAAAMSASRESAGGPGNSDDPGPSAA